jgi:hypothetical protein
MHLYLATALLTATIFPAFADSLPNCADNWTHLSASDKANTTYLSYSKECAKKDPNTGTMSTPPMPQSAAAMCKKGPDSANAEERDGCLAPGGVDTPPNRAPQ